MVRTNYFPNQAAVHSIKQIENITAIENHYSMDTEGNSSWKSKITWNFSCRNFASRSPGCRRETQQRRRCEKEFEIGSGDWWSDPTQSGIHGQKLGNPKRCTDNFSYSLLSYPKKKMFISKRVNYRLTPECGIYLYLAPSECKQITFCGEKKILFWVLTFLDKSALPITLIFV